MIKTKTIKETVMSYYQEHGTSPTRLARMFKVPRRTVNDWILKFKETMADSFIVEDPKFIKHEPFGTWKYGQELKSNFGPGGHAVLELNSSITKTVVLSDIHLPYNIDLEPVFKFIQYLKPDYVVLNGDIADWNCFSPHDPISIDRPLSFMEQKNMCIELLQKLQQLSKAKITWIQGNHEDWARQAALRNPEISGTVEQHCWLPKSIVYVPLNYCAQIGKLKIIHGNCLRNERTALPTRTMLSHWSESHLLFGHYHKRETYTQVSEIGSEKRYAEMSGCLCHVNPAYARNTPNAVTNGFAYIISEKDGNYWSVFPAIHHGKFIAEGKLFK